MAPLNQAELLPRLLGALKKARQELLNARNPDGYWVGDLSSSALSTATAVCALAVVERETSGHASPITRHASLVNRGLEWLARHANADGGWGDTALSLSNISTTALCWAAFGVVSGADDKYRRTVSDAERWLIQRAGGVEPHLLAPAITKRYGKDRTFSVPILTMCALAGRFGSQSEAWRWVLPLPFELAACPHRWFAALKLPVVSYALPALIAIGQARHHHFPSRNPFARTVRNLTRNRTLKILGEIQPSSGGFLEATPLTSFVVMSLAGSGQVNHPTTVKGAEFLRASTRPDGSWPIDTNLATWVTTLSVNALSAARGPVALDNEARENIREWLLSQQYREEHPYTHAAPGGWAWTDLPGGVPDADDTAGALLALRKIGSADQRTRAAVTAGVGWLLGLQNRDGGIPTFCKGWGALPFDRSSPDLTAHALRAWAAWRKELPGEMQSRVRKAMAKGLTYLAESQRLDGSWVPLWFGNQFIADDENPVYGTARVLPALQDLAPTESPVADALLERGTEWLLSAQHGDGGWGGAPDGPSSTEESALALEALAGSAVSIASSREARGGRLKAAVEAGVRWLIEQVESGQWKTPAPIGFYFAKLWYYERLYPQIFTVAALQRVIDSIQEERFP